MKKIIHNPHDKFFRSSLADARVAKAFFQQHLPSAITKLIDLNQLSLQKDSFIDEHFKLAISDALFATQFANHTGYLYVLVEHQTKPEHLMPFRLLKYMVAIMEQHLKKTSPKRLPIVYPLLFYTGSQAYSYSMDLFDLFDGPENLAKQVFLKPFQLVDVSQIPDEKLREDVWSGIMEMCMKYVWSRDILKHLDDMLNLMKQAETVGGESYIVTSLSYLLSTGELKDEHTFLSKVQTYLSAKTGDKVMTGAERLIARGLAEGIEKGIEKGQIEARKAIAKNLLQEGVALDAVIRITGLNEEQIESLITQSH